jgi:hypothetical protein
MRQLAQLQHDLERTQSQRTNNRERHAIKSEERLLACDRTHMDELRGMVRRQREAATSSIICTVTPDVDKTRTTSDTIIGPRA